MTAGLHWSLKASFVRYILGMQDGVYAVTEDASADPEFVFTFPVKDISGFDPATGLGALQFRGAVRFGGHGGMLYVMIADPIVTVTAEGAVLSAKVDNDGERLDIVNLDVPENGFGMEPRGLHHEPQPDLQWDSVATSLTAAGASLFIGQYPVGTAFDPLSITLSV
ncbi:MAG: HtaA domain-containing protein [Actinomycetales bacterium]|nr:HtaA domain-containing protein [Actinomycetales bacterium]